MTPCNVVAAAAAAARALPGAAVSCQAQRSRLGRGIAGRRPPRACGTRAQPRARTMRAAPCEPLLQLLLLALLAVPAARASRAQSAAAPQPEPGPGNTTQPQPAPGDAAAGGGNASSDDALATRISSLLRDLPTLKAAVIVACAFAALLIACLLLRVFRWVRLPLAFPRGSARPRRLRARTPWAPAPLRAAAPDPAPKGCARLVSLAAF